MLISLGKSKSPLHGDTSCSEIRAATLACCERLLNRVTHCIMFILTLRMASLSGLGTSTPGKRSDTMPLNSGTSNHRNFGKLTSMIDLPAEIPGEICGKADSLGCKQGRKHSASMSTGSVRKHRRRTKMSFSSPLDWNAGRWVIYISCVPRLL